MDAKNNKNLDIACGGIDWVPKTRAFSLLDCTEIDINPKLIDTHSAKNFSQNFLCLDAIADELPIGEVTISRVVVFHM